MTCHEEKNITTNRYLPIKSRHAMIKILMRATHDAVNERAYLPFFFILISREFIVLFDLEESDCKFEVKIKFTLVFFIFGSGNSGSLEEV